MNDLLKTNDVFSAAKSFTSASCVGFMLLPLQSGQHIKVLKTVLMQFLEKLFDTNASDATVQTGCNILKVHFEGLGMVRSRKMIH